jgi:hypothetical protein
MPDETENGLSDIYAVPIWSSSVNTSELVNTHASGSVLYLFL